MTRSKPTPHGDDGPGQRRVIDFLSTAGAIDAHMPEVHMTHASVVFAGRERALKIKRAVHLPFLDYSTLEKRRAACQREVEVNQVTAPAVYLGVVPITERSDGRLGVGGPGMAVEWAVEMRAFAQDDLLSRRVDAGRFDIALAEQTADVVREMHERAAIVDGIDAVAKMRSIVREIVTTLRQIAPDAMMPAVELLAARAEQRVVSAAAVIRQRAARGLVRRCHGDLHLANLVLWEGRPTPFDAIEFSEEIASVDTLYDLAFLLMDLDHRGARAAANAVFNRYMLRARTLDDIEGLAALPLYLGMRAGIRAMVATERGIMLDAETPPARAASAEAESYLAHALRNLAPASPRLIAVGGLSGSGKSTLAATLAPGMEPAPGALLLRSDTERKAMLGHALDARLPRETYTAEMSARVYARLHERAAAALAAGHSVVVDAVFQRPDERAAIEHLARDTGAPFCGLWLAADAARLRERVATRTGDASDATPDVVDLQLTRDAGAISWPVIDAGDGAAETHGRALAALEQAQRR